MLLRLGVRCLRDSFCVSGPEMLSGNPLIERVELTLSVFHGSWPHGFLDKMWLACMFALAANFSHSLTVLTK